MACAFFTSVWQVTPIGQQQQQELICHYSLTKLLELCQISVLDFFDKLNKWAEMILASRRLQEFVNRVQSNLAVSAVIFKKFLPIYRHVFVNIQLPSPTRAHHKSSRYANMPQKLTSRALLELTWLFYISMRSKQIKIILIYLIFKNNYRTIKRIYCIPIIYYCASLNIFTMH